MAVMANSIGMKVVESDRRADWKASVLSEVAGLMIGFVTLIWIVSSLNAL